MSLSVSVSRNGILIPSAQACVSVFNPAIYGAYGVYESMQVVNGAAFEQAAHLKRLVHSAAILGLPLPADPATLEGWITEAIAAHNATNAGSAYTLRIFVIGPDNGGEVVAYIWPQPHPVYPAEYYTQGAPAITFEGYRYLPQAKSLNALASYMAQRQARAADAHEALLHHDGCLTEGSNSNVFAVLAGTVVTPPAREVLSGVTRDIVIPLAAGDGIPLAEAPLPLAGLPRWDECFITSTSRHVMPVTAIDGRPVGNGQVGPVTRRLMALFESYFAQHTAHA
jgi:branched-subunit amino acid aminotransferase/4-amino-4-deoxychorismate lyase